MCHLLGFGAIETLSLLAHNSVFKQLTQLSCLQSISFFLYIYLSFCVDWLFVDKDDGRSSGSSEEETDSEEVSQYLERPQNKRRRTSPSRSSRSNSGRSSTSRRTRKVSTGQVLADNSNTMVSDATRLKNARAQNKKLEEQLAATQAALAAAQGPPTAPTGPAAAPTAPTEDPTAASTSVAAARQSSRIAARLAGTNATGGTHVPPPPVAAAPAPASVATNGEPNQALMKIFEEAMKKKKGKKRQNLETTDDNFKAMIHTAIKDNGGWRTKKFIVSPAGLRDFAHKVCVKMGVKEFKGDDPVTVSLRQKWVEAYESMVLRVFNEHRNYVQGQIKRVCDEYMDMEENIDHVMPSMTLLEKCIKRTIDLNIPEEKSFFWWYWTELLPKAVGNGSDWNESLFNYYPISMAAPPNKPNEKYVTPSTEAFAYLAVANNYVKWPKMRQVKLDNPSAPGMKMKYIAMVKNKDGVRVREDTVSVFLLIILANVLLYFALISSKLSCQSHRLWWKTRRCS